MRQLRRVVGGLLLALSAVIVVVLVMGRFTGRGAGPPRRPPVTVAVGGDSAVDIQPSQYREFALWLPPRICTLTGHVQTAGAARSTFEALVFDQVEFEGWLQSRRAGSVRSGEVSSWDPHVTLVGPGRYHLVIRNPLGTAPIRILIDSAKATCP